MPMNLGFTRGQIIQEFYVDDDVDQKLREAVEASTAEQLVDVDYGDVVDGAIVWWRADDAEEEDLADVLVDALSNLDDGGLIWVLIPKPHGLPARRRRGGRRHHRGPALDDGRVRGQPVGGHPPDRPPPPTVGPARPR